MDQAAYGQDDFTIGNSRVWAMKAICAGIASCCSRSPIDYIPAQGAMLTVSDIEITIQLTGSDLALTRARQRAMRNRPKPLLWHRNFSTTTPRRRIGFDSAPMAC